MSFSASVFIPVKPKGFDLTLSEKISWYSLGALVIYTLPMLFIENYYDYRFPQWVYYPSFLFFLLNFSSNFIRLTEFENLNGYFEGRITFNDEFITIDNSDYKYSDIEDLIVYGNSFSGEKTSNHKSGPMYGNGTKNLISFTSEGIKIEKHFQLNSEKHLDQLQEVLLHIITNEKIPYKRKYLNFINEEYRRFIIFEFFIGKLIKEKRIECTEGLLLIGYDSDKEARELRAKYCC
ncbi:hypothetical protein [Flavobacterium reichenbachii]|uniref:Uncharacterized protein n=1 Tax=Flavobacterium reichenbachii TaxID=362418 RepID=A0A085ZK08_9FLAO|nr:hypothetical protein [Flavobacterium reichenbachii]KFF04772.1 hypothetical protein IW19_04140 [Flavobacterium reichenbachii]OXB10329.1 hypothetical protein B0A68_22315 [Flavobacterium reichenbachii]